MNLNWNDWYKHYDSLPSLQERLRIVCELVVAALDDCPPGPIQIVSICAGDGRDLIHALENHPRRADVTALLIDSNAESIARGKTSAEAAGLGKQLRFVEGDATLAKNYAGAVPADIVLLSGFLGHLRHEDVPELIRSLPMFCKTDGSAIWNRHLVLYDGREQVAAIREFFQQNQFVELHYEMTAPDGFAVARARFDGSSQPLDVSRQLFEFVGLDRLLADESAETKSNSVPVASVAEIPAISRARIFEEAETSIPARFRQMVALHPRRIAIGGGNWQPTYEELDAVTNRLANTIIARGGKAGDRVAILMRHDAPLVATALAVLKAGRVVVVLNPTEPILRLKQILEDAAPNCIVTDATNDALAKQIAEENQTILHFEKDQADSAAVPAINPAPTDLAWLIYTSGSTGQPKGVMQTHRNIAHNVLRLSLGMKLTADDRIILLGSPSGGQGVATLWCGLLNGATLCPFPTVEKGVVGLKEWIWKNHINIYVSSASVFRHFAKSLDAADQFPEVRVVRFGSETSLVSDFNSYQKHFSNASILINTLSSSETGNITQHHFSHDGRVNDGRLPVGQPTAGIDILLLDENGRPVRTGESGEIVVRSHYLSPGYWKNEPLTVERFQGNGDPRELRSFHSGDLGSWGADGSLRFMDRKDTRVKIRGYRVEVSEVEEALLALKSVESVFVTTHAATNGETQLVAYVVLGNNQSGAPGELRRELRQSLPGYMVPTHFVFREKFPLTPHGKVDRKALPPPDEAKILSKRSERPRDIVERSLALIWENVLGVESVGRQDDFFDLGGNSLQSTQILGQIEESFGASLPPSTLTEHGTIEKLAALLAGHIVRASNSPLVVLREADSGRPFFLIHSGQGDVATFGLLTRRLTGRPIYGLQSVGLNGESWPLMNVPAMARRYVHEITAKDPTGPYLLGGTCMGGLVALEMAKILSAEGKQVALLAMIDVRHPINSWRQSGWRQKWLQTSHEIFRDTLRIARWGAIRGVGLGRGSRWLSSYRRFVAHMNSLAARNYRPFHFPGAMHLFITTDTKFPKDDLRLMLRACADKAHIITISGIRRSLFMPPTVDELAQKLQAVLDETDKRIVP